MLPVSELCGHFGVSVATEPGIISPLAPIPNSLTLYARNEFLSSSRYGQYRFCCPRNVAALALQQTYAF
jgi:hypothetical protein